MNALAIRETIKKDDFILDDDYKYYHIYYDNDNKQYKKIIKHNDVLELLKKGLEYKCVSNYGFYRLINFKSKLFVDEFNKINNNTY